MEDLFLSDDGRAVFDVLDGNYDREGGVPCQIDGGLKCFVHPIGASGLGGVPYQGAAAISILGLN